MITTHYEHNPWLLHNVCAVDMIRSFNFQNQSFNAQGSGYANHQLASKHYVTAQKITNQFQNLKTHPMHKILMKN